jgi:hypothetical protein
VLSIGKWNFWLDKGSITVYADVIITSVRVLSKPSSLRWESSLGLLVPF